MAERLHIPARECRILTGPARPAGRHDLLRRGSNGAAFPLPFPPWKRSADGPAGRRPRPVGGSGGREDGRETPKQDHVGWQELRGGGRRCRNEEAALASRDSGEGDAGHHDEHGDQHGVVEAEEVGRGDGLLDFLGQNH
jgi:hypothetical protein